MNQNINVDLIPKFAVYGNLYFSQYDVGREAIINLVNGSTEYEIPSGATVTLVATKPSGLGFTQNCTFEGNQITVVCTAEMTDEAGHFPCEIRIANGSLLLGTANFTFNVERSPHPEGTTDGTADSVISQITVAFESAMTQIENSGGLTNDIKEALLNCFQKVAWIDGDGQVYYDALEEALYNVEVTGITLNSSSLLFNELNQTSQLTATLIPSTATNPISWSSSDTSVCTVVNGLVTSVGYGSATITASAGSVSATCSVSIVETTVVSLNAVLNGGTFYVGDPVDNIKPYLTVTATWSDSTSSTVPSGSYTLSGSLSNVGANTITVSYGGQSTTVTVNAVSVELVSISAVYTQSGTVYDTDTLDSLKSDLVVTATYSDSSTATVPSTDYTLSGTLTVGTSVITVTYEGKTATFNVTVATYEYNYSISNGRIVKLIGATQIDTGHASDITLNYSNLTRRSYPTERIGVKPMVDRDNNYSPTAYYPIPVPPDATSVTVEITPSTQYHGISMYTYDNSTGYTRTLDPGWKQGSYTYTFAAGQYQYFTAVSKYNTSGSTYPDEPTEFTITFE